MKCPSCGAETKGEVCEFCGSELPKEKQNINITNNFYGNNNQENNQQSNSRGSCCPKCGGNTIKFTREKIGTARQGQSKSTVRLVGTGRKGTSTSQNAYRTVGICQSCGFTWDATQGSGTTGNNSKKSRTWLWVLGWIFIFPIPLTILMLRNEKLDKKIRYGIIAAAWIVYLVIGFGGQKNNTENANTAISEETVVQSAENNTEEKVVQSAENSTVEETVVEEKTDEEKLDEYISNIVDSYNAQAEEQLVYVEDFVPSDHESGHYRTEFRLQAWKNALGKSYLLGDKVVDLVANPSWSDDYGFRVYTNDASLDQILALVRGMSPLMEEDLSAADLNKTLDYLEEKKTANGYYYGDNLGIVLLGSDTKGYELMLKKGN